MIKILFLTLTTKKVGCDVPSLNLQQQLFTTHLHGPLQAIRVMYAPLYFGMKGRHVVV